MPCRLNGNNTRHQKTIKINIFLRLPKYGNNHGKIVDALLNLTRRTKKQGGSIVFQTYTPWLDDKMNQRP